MPQVINAELLTNIQTGFNTAFNNAFNGYSPFWQKGVAMQVPSSTKTQIYPWLGKSTRFREWLGERVLQNLEAHGFSITNKHFENTFVVDRNDIEDDQVGVYMPMATSLGNDAAQHPDIMVFNLLKQGASTLCYDGQNFFDTDHPVKNNAGQTQSVANLQNGAAPRPWFMIDASKAIRPVIYQVRKPYQFIGLTNPDSPNVFNRNEYIYGADGRSNVGLGLWQTAYMSNDVISADNVAEIRASMSQITGDNGNLLGIMPTILVCSVADEKAAKEAVVAERNAAGATNVMAGVVSIVSVPWL